MSSRPPAILLPSRANASGTTLANLSKLNGRNPRPAQRGPNLWTTSIRRQGLSPLSSVGQLGLTRLRRPLPQAILAAILSWASNEPSPQTATSLAPNRGNGARDARLVGSPPLDREELGARHLEGRTVALRRLLQLSRGACPLRVSERGARKASSSRRPRSCTPRTAVRYRGVGDPKPVAAHDQGRFGTIHRPGRGPGHSHLRPHRRRAGLSPEEDAILGSSRASEGESPLRPGGLVRTGLRRYLGQFPISHGCLNPRARGPRPQTEELLKAARAGNRSSPRSRLRGQESTDPQEGGTFGSR